MSVRILIIGSSCSGKTTLGGKLAREFDGKHIDLDDLAWLPNWQQEERPKLESKIKAAIDGVDTWVISGSYSYTWAITMPRATHIVFLDLPYPVLLWRLIRRSFRRHFKKEKCCGENQERLLHSLWGKDSLLMWQMKNFKRKREQYRGQQQNPINPDAKLMRLEGKDIHRAADMIKLSL